MQVVTRIEFADAMPARPTIAGTAPKFAASRHNCGEAVTFQAPPERAVVNDDNMIELMFALGLTDRMAAYAASYPRLRLAAFTDDYAAVPSLGDDYMALEPVLGMDPDFVFAGWNYGFGEGEITPARLAELYRKAGARNVFEDLRQMWGTVSWETFVEAAPELIVVTD